jgi:hypothetical protein
MQVDGDVFDVSSNSRTYGPGGPYHHMWVYATCFSDFLTFICRVGVDAARSFGTGCFATHRTHDLRGLTDNELRVGDNGVFRVHTKLICRYTCRASNIGRSSLPSTKHTTKLARSCTTRLILKVRYLNIVIRRKSRQVIQRPGILTRYPILRVIQQSARSYSLQAELLMSVIIKIVGMYGMYIR